MGDILYLMQMKNEICFSNHLMYIIRWKIGIRWKKDPISTVTKYIYLMIIIATTLFFFFTELQLLCWCYTLILDLKILVSSFPAFQAIWTVSDQLHLSLHFISILFAKFREKGHFSHFLCQNLFQSLKFCLSPFK
jgi:hypothetical protein